MKCRFCDGRGFTFRHLIPDPKTSGMGLIPNPHPVETCWWCKGKGEVRFLDVLKRHGVA